MKKKKNLKHFQTLRFHLYNIPEMTKLQKWRLDQRLLGIKEKYRKKVGVTIKGILVVM